MNSRTSFHQSGVGLIEAMVALLILTVGLIPVLAVVSSSNNLSALIRNNLIAANLAQEGIEVIRGLRDENWFSGQSFDNGLIGTWRVQWNTSWTNPPQQVGTNPSLKFDSATGLYGYSAGADTQFKRTVTVSLVGTCNCEMKIVGEVTWPERGRNRVIKAESHLFNWK